MWLSTLLTVALWGGFLFIFWRSRVLLLAPLVVLLGRWEIRLGGGNLAAGFYRGKLAVASAYPLAEVKRLVVRPWHPGGCAPSEADVVAERIDGAVLELSASRLPFDTARAVVAHIAERCGLPTGGDHAPAPTVSESLVFTPVEECDAPAGTRVRVEEFADGVTVTVPPVGVWRASPKLLVGGSLYAAFLLFATVMFLFFDPQGRRKEENEDVVLLAFMIGHWLAASSMIGLALGRGLRRAAFALVGGEIRYTHRGLFARATEAWPVGDLADVRFAVQVADPLACVLRLTLKSGQTRDLLEESDVGDLYWVAVVLRRALGMPLTPTRRLPAAPAR